MQAPTVTNHTYAPTAMPAAVVAVWARPLLGVGRAAVHVALCDRSQDKAKSRVRKYMDYLNEQLPKWWKFLKARPPHPPPRLQPMPRFARRISGICHFICVVRAYLLYQFFKNYVK